MYKVKHFPGYAGSLTADKVGEELANKFEGQTFARYTEARKAVLKHTRLILLRGYGIGRVDIIRIRDEFCMPWSM